MIRDSTATFITLEKTAYDLRLLMETRGEAFLVADDAGACLGFVTWGPFRAGPGYAHTAEHSIIAATPAKGIGCALIQSALARARAQGIHMMIGCMNAENTAAIAFHGRLGFALAGHLPQVGRKAGRWHDLILMNRLTATP